MKRSRFGCPWLALLLLSGALPAQAHGSNVQFRTTEAIEIQAQFDSGTPMSEAQVTVYAPDDPATPWLQGITDERGHFTFTPDPARAGNWEVKVRQAGHGDIISVPVGELASETVIAQTHAADSTSAATTAEPTDSTPAATTAEQPALIARADWSGSAYTPLQKWLMAASGLWGFIGTALFFTRRKG
ncbi:MAG: carboxypeptidase regulatory-like domain-containing protein [Spirulinaceae cyanobacterium RM2_2_10]|nr:carboxypeptidase regulatory-like domain-containing protein [Spirulinaceae cyanobacterium SM2_1_0]NJO21384.1 carboxypeptidase regulatory-like domain-containing protein [Spirulinaceae cyanobacterium RM2_2_10]